MQHLGCQPCNNNKCHSLTHKRLQGFLTLKILFQHFLYNVTPSWTLIPKFSIAFAVESFYMKAPFLNPKILKPLVPYHQALS